MSIYDQLVDELDARLTKLRTKPLSAEEDKIEIENLGKLLDKKIEMDRARDEAAAKEQQLKGELAGRWIVAGAGVVTTLITLGFSYYAMQKSFEFEKEGTVTTILGRGFVNFFSPKR